MRSKSVIAAVLVLLFLLVGASAALADTIHVPDDYATIQAAVDAAAPGDVVAVAAGTYLEHVTIAKPLTLAGAGAGATVIDGSGSGPVLTVSGAGVTVRDLTVTNGGSDTHPASNGVRVSGATGASFAGVEVSFCEAAYMVVSSSGTTVRNGAMHDNHAFGFDNGDTFSPDTLLEDCEVFDNLGTQGGGAINAYAGSSGFTVRRTHLHDNVNAAVQIGWSGGWLLEDSTLEGNAHGLILDSANSGTCRGNEISDNTGYGVALAGWGTMNNLFTANAIRGNDQGCRVSGPNANANTFRENTIAANAVGVAVTLNASGDNSGNLFYRNNFAGNTLQATDASLGGNAWDNGLPDGGNWWSDWTAPDADHDGFVDAAYVFTGGQDDYPFAERLPAIHVPDDYATIQAAVDAAAPGDVVAVAAGTYLEHVTIAKPLTLAGAGAGATVIDGSGSGPVLTVSGAGVTVRDLTVTNGGSDTHPASNGVRVSGATGASFAGVEVSFCEAAYMVVSSSGTTVRNGAMHDNHAFGFDNGDTFSPDTLLEDCEVFDNLGTQGGGAINAYAGSSGFTVRRTHLHDNVNAAVQIGWSGGWLLEDSTLEGNAHGLILDSANSGTCRGNEISDNTGYGVALAGWGTMNNLFTANAIRGNDQGCRVSGPNANANTFRENTIAANAVGVAVTLNASGDNSGNLFYRNNFAGNTLQATDASLGGNAWDNGLPDGGNWWSDWTAPDADHDGFVDAAYVFTGGQDDYPFAERLPAIHVPDDYATIQAAVDAAAPGDVVAVAAGTYLEHVTIAKPLTLAGAGAGATVIDGSGSGPVLTVSGAGVTVRDLTVTNGGSDTHPASNGVRVSGATGASFAGVEVSFCEAAYMVVSSSGTTVRNGAMHDNHAFGFDNGDTFSPDTLLEDCEVFDNLGTQGGGAINAYAGSSGFTVRRTHLHDNVNAAVQIGWSGGWLLEDSTLEGNAHGLILDSANSGTCRGNEISDNTGYGVALAGWGTMNNLFTANAIRGNDQGCRVSGPNANANTFRENTIAANAVGVAVTLNASGDNSGNLFYRNNFAGNTLQATDASLGGNAWDNGLPDGGNWWSDWTAPDADHDGFVDAAYVFTGGQDDYPFAERLPAIHVPDDYATIQAAVDAAAPGDVVAVAAGTYLEHVTIAKPLTLAGAGAGATVIDGSGSGPVLTVSGAGVTVRDLTVTNGGSDTHPASNGVRVSGATGASFAGVEVSFCEAAYMVVSSSGTTVRNGAMHDNHAFGFDNGDTFSPDTLLEDCEVFDNLGTQGGGAINAYAGSSGFTVRRTHLHDNVNAAVQIGWSGGWLLEDSTLEGNAHGLILDSANSGTCRGNEISDNTGYGVALAGWGTMNNLFTANAIRGNDQGCRVSGPNANANTFRENTIAANAVGVAVTLNASGDNSGNLFYRNNFAGNTLQATDASLGGNAWDNGLPDGGNWWSDWTAPDADHDGFVDAAYVFTGGQDDYPFAREVGSRAFEVHRTVENGGAFTSVYFKGWSIGVTLTLAVDDPATPESPDYETTVVAEAPQEGGDGFGMGIDYEVKPGDVVTVTDGSLTKSHTVTDIAVTEIDTAADVVRGTAVPGSELTVYCPTTSRGTSAAGDGTWMVDFSVSNEPDQAIYDILPGSTGGAEQFDADGDSTVYDWAVPDPFFSVSPIDPAEHMWGEEWAPDSEVLIEIDDLDTAEPVDFSMTAGTNGNGRFELFDIPFDVKAGHVVTVSQGAMVKTHVVIDLRVTSMDPVADSVSGIGKPDTETVVNVWDDPAGEGSQRIVMSDGSGAWTADFSVPGADGSPAFDIRPGIITYTYQADEDRDQTQIDYRLLSITVTVPDGSQSWPAGSTQTLGWTVSSAVDAGQFGVWLIDQTTGSWYSAGYFDAEAGETDYTPSFSTLGIPEGTYSAVVYYREDPGQWVWAANATSPGTAEITPAAFALTVTVPDGSQSWPAGSTQTLGWTVSSAVDAGQFGVWLIDQTTGSWYSAGYFDAEAGETDYTPSFSTLGIPEGTYSAVVYYREDPGQWVWAANATSPGTAEITPAAFALTVTVPDGSQSWPAGSTQTLGWTVSSAVDAGQFGVWLIDQTTGSWYSAGYFDAEAGETDYTPSFSTLGIPEGTYSAVVYYREDPGQWVWAANATSPGTAEITPAAFALTVTVPDGSQSWPAGSTQTLGWTVSSAVDAGQFGVWLIDQTTGSWYSAGYFDAEAGETDYTPSFSTLGIPEGTYSAVVYYREDPGQWVWAANATSPGTAEITPAAFALTVTVPDGSQSWPAGSTQTLGWTVSSAVDAGQFGVWLIDQTTGSWYSAGYFDAEAGETDYTPSFSTLGIPEGTYSAVVYYREDPGQWVWAANATSPGTAEITP